MIGEGQGGHAARGLEPKGFSLHVSMVALGPSNMDSIKLLPFGVSGLVQYHSITAAWELRVRFVVS